MLFRDKQIEQIARKFHAMVRLSCMTQDLEMIDRLNSLTPEKPCATHGFVDADAFMAFAFEDVTGAAYDRGDEVARTITELAWDLARSHGYATDW